MKISFRDGFLLGAASAATQIEGGELNHSWTDWAKKGRIKDGSRPSRANNHIRYWKNDLDMMKSMGIKIYRLGIEWARIEPENGVFNKKAIEFYMEMLSYMKELDIKPLVTLHHFTNPMWFEHLEGFTRVENVKYYLRFVKRVVSAFGGLAGEYITINEPNVYATNSYFYGEWPPGEKSLMKALTVMSVMAACHIKAYELIHSRRRSMGFYDTKVGFAHHMRVFRPESRFNPWHRLCTHAVQHLFQSSVTKAFCTGKFSLPLKKPFQLPQGEFSDFIAINYYSRSTISGFGDGVAKNVPKNDLDWEIYPQGIELCAAELHRVLKRPIYITENGTCDNHDAFRCRYIYDHLKVISDSRLPFERYYHWCFCDNFEWLEGESARFGLVHVDYPTQKRTVKKSGHFYSKIIEHHGVTNEMYQESVQPEHYHR